jgi:hypothetical protein
LFDCDVRDIFQGLFHRAVVFVFVYLGAEGENGCAFCHVEHADLYCGFVCDCSHQTAQCVDFANEVTFCSAADGWVAGEVGDAVQIHGG